MTSTDKAHRVEELKIEKAQEIRRLENEKEEAVKIIEKETEATIERLEEEKRLAVEIALNGAKGEMAQQIQDLEAENEAMRARQMELEAQLDGLYASGLLSLICIRDVLACLTILLSLLTTTISVDARHIHASMIAFN